MKKNKILSLVFILVFGLLAACSSGASETSNEGNASGGAEGNADDKIKIGISYQNLQNEYIVAFQTALKDKVSEVGGIELIEADGMGKPEEQVSQIENFITQGVDVIILNPQDANGSAPAVSKAAAANIPIVTVLNFVANQDEVTSHVGSDDVEAGKIEMEYIAELLGGKGKIAIIHGPNGMSAEIKRSEGNYAVLEQYPDIEVVAEQTANWSRAEALSLTENWLQTFELDAVVGQNDEMALGAVKALEASGQLDDVHVIGIDAIPDALQAVKDGKLAATVLQDAKTQGAKAVETALKAAKGEELEDINYVPFQLITQEDVDQFMN